jgi:hypothetical protein
VWTAYPIQQFSQDPSWSAAVLYYTLPVSVGPGTVQYTTPRYCKALFPVLAPGLEQFGCSGALVWHSYSVSLTALPINVIAVEQLIVNEN